MKEIQWVLLMDISIWSKFHPSFNILFCVFCFQKKNSLIPLVKYIPHLSSCSSPCSAQNTEAKLQIKRRNNHWPKIGNTNYPGRCCMNVQSAELCDISFACIGHDNIWSRSAFLGSQLGSHTLTEMVTSSKPKSLVLFFSGKWDPN